jgi:predicted metalloprotease with PDZ domain
VRHRAAVALAAIMCLCSAFALSQTATVPPQTTDELRVEQANAPHEQAQGTITLVVDASDAPRKIFHARLTIPARAGDFVLVYPKWIPGEHGPTGPIDDLAGLRFTAGGQTLTWRRDLIDMWALHVQVPQGVTQIEAALDYLSPANPSGFSAGASATANLTVISWNQVLLYPQGTDSHQVMFQPSLRLPAGWKFGTALQAQGTGETVRFAPVPLNVLVDSPVITGRYFRNVDITPAGESRHHEIDIAADSAAALEMSPDLQAHYKQLVAETGALFGARHYNEYHFLLTLSDQVAHFGLEHHQSSDDRVAERSIIEENERKLSAGLLPHEFTHSWNGKYRRPSDLTTPNFQVPMESDLLWVYEGLTEYIGDMLAGRSGLWTPEQYRENLANIAALLSHRPGRTWRPLVDTTIAAQQLYNAPESWISWRRGTDFYDEGELIWLDADATIRSLTHDRKSLDDFTHLFHGGPSGDPVVKPYTFDQLVEAMNQVAPYDWRKFFNDRLTSLAPGAPLGGIEGGGWRLMYNDTPNEMIRSAEVDSRSANFAYSLGLLLDDKGSVVDAIIDSPAYRANIGPGMTIVAVNGRKYAPEVLHDALRAAKADKNAPLDLLTQNGEFYFTARVNYHDSDMYPHLVRDASKPDLLTEIIRQHAPAAR